MALRIDCDIHPAVGGTRTTLLPYLSAHWQEQVTSRAIDGLDLTSYPPAHAAVGAGPTGGPRKGKPGSGPGDVVQAGARRARLEPRHPQRALWRPGRVRSLHGRRLLQGDQRLDRRRVAGPGSAAAGLDRRADAGARPRRRGDRAAGRRQALRLGAGAGAGRAHCWARRHFWPMHAAAERHKLPLAIHAGSQYRAAPSSIGWPSYRYEYYLAEAQAAQAQILSLVLEGVFGKFPGLKVVMAEIGRIVAAGLHVAHQQDLARRARRSAVGRPPRRSRSCAITSA